MSAIVERRLFAASIGSAVFVAAVGAMLAVQHSEGHILNRAGAAIVCIESLIVLIEFFRRQRIQKLEEQSHSHNPYFKVEVDRAERQLVIAGVLMAIFGELLHGFGDLVLRWAGFAVH